MSPEPGFRLAPLGQRAAPAHAEGRTAGYANGYAEGWSAGTRAAAAEAERRRAELAAEHTVAEARRDEDVARSVAALTAAVRAADARTAPVVEDLRGALVAAAVDLAQAVLGRELAEGGAARAALERALAVPADLGAVTVRLSPGDHAEITSLVAAGSVTLPDGVALVADTRLAVGDAISEHPTGYLDAQLSTALDRARRALEE